MINVLSTSVLVQRNSRFTYICVRKCDFKIRDLKSFKHDQRTNFCLASQGSRNGLKCKQEFKKLNGGYGFDAYDDAYDDGHGNGNGDVHGNGNGDGHDGHEGYAYAYGYDAYGDAYDNGHGNGNAYDDAYDDGHGNGNVTVTMLTTMAMAMAMANAMAMDTTMDGHCSSGRTTSVEIYLLKTLVLLA